MLKLCVLTCFANMLQWAESFVGTQRCLPVVVAQLVASQCASAVHVILSVSVVHVDSVPASQCTSAVHVFLCDCCASQFPVVDSVPVSQCACVCCASQLTSCSSQCALYLSSQCACVCCVLPVHTQPGLSSQHRSVEVGFHRSCKYTHLPHTCWYLY